MGQTNTHELRPRLPPFKKGGKWGDFQGETLYSNKSPIKNYGYDRNSQFYDERTTAGGSGEICVL